jgi:iron complex outermembrane recepter protein
MTDGRWGLARMRRRLGAAAALSTLALASLCAAAEDDDLELAELSKMSLEELMSTRVTSVAGVEEGWFQTPASMYVITNEDVRRTGHRTLADALRVAPGVFVGQVNSHAWTVGTRGFNGGLANKTLVLIDGRRVYDPLFSGTYWDVQDVLLEDLDRIEIIRGPGPTLWGSNAVNGVFNIMTKSARDTQGLYVGAGGGTHERGFGEARYGGQIGENQWYRVYGKYLERDELEMRGPTDGHDDWNQIRGGFRYDLDNKEDGFLTVQGDIYNSPRLGESVRVPVPDATAVFEQNTSDARTEGGNLLVRFGQEAKDNGWRVQAYYDRAVRVVSAGFQVERDSGEIDFRHHFRLGERNELIWGLTAYSTYGQTEAGPTFILDPEGRAFTTLSAFVQDTFTIVEDRLFAMVGSKFEHNSFTGFEVQPSGRLWWTPSDRHTLWGAISRAVRVPSRTEEDALLVFLVGDPGVLAGGAPTGVFLPFGVSGSNDVDSEELIAYEAGYRVKPIKNVTADLSLFFNDYDRLLLVPPAVIGTTFNNDGFGESYGGELSVTWRVADNWRLEAGYSYTRVEIHGPVLEFDEGNTPRHQAQLRSYLDVTKEFEFNAALYYVDTVPTPDADAYLRLDLGVTWHVTENFDLTVWGQNLTDKHHQEFTALEPGRGVYVMGTLRF